MTKIMINLKKAVYWCLLVFIASSCTPDIFLPRVTQIQPTEIESKQLYPDFEKHIDLRFRDLKRLEKSLIKAVRKNQNDHTVLLTSKLLPTYYRQYIAYVDTNGNKQCWIIGSCRLFEDYKELPSGEFEQIPFDWKNRILEVDDGGDCFWRFWINKETKEYHLFVNEI